MTITFAHCLREGCGRKLTAAASVARGFGPTCHRRILAKLAALAGFTADQLGKARELVEDGGIAPVRRGIYRVASSDGTKTYLTAASGHCNCPAGERGRSCYHVATALIVSA